jgi:hypothetical protein
MMNVHTLRVNRRRAPWVLALSSILLALTMGEALARGLWRMKYGVPFFDPGKILYTVYPELRLVDAARPRHDDAFYDILLLGGSTLHPDWGRVEAELLDQLLRDGHRDVRIFNLARPAHSSRDSLLKYEAVGDARFEMVVVYDGINEARTNNVPPNLFKDDYSHYAWYEVANELAPHHGHARFALPYTGVTLFIWIKQALTKDRYVPRLPRAEWTHFGREVRSAKPFARNLESIATLAAARGDHLLVMTFATYMPPGYSLKAFEEKRLDYAGHREPIETWGEPVNVMAAVARHNDAVRALAARRPEVSLVDQANLMPGSGQNFDDVCHFTSAGSARFARNLLDRWPWRSPANPPKRYSNASFRQHK